MFSARGVFSTIPCPFKAECKLPQCLFLHSSTQEPDYQPESSEDDARRKRQKLDVHRSKDVVKASSSILAARPVPVKKSVDAPKKDSALKAATISPPTPEEKKIKSFYAPMPKAKKLVQAETLNPRSVVPAPAKHDIRYRLLQMLHEHFARLNAQLAKGDDVSKHLVLPDHRLVKMALDMEEAAARDKPTIYSNVIKNKVQLYKRMSIADWKKEREAELEAEAAEVSGTAPKKAVAAPKPIETGLSETHELLLLPRLYTDFLRTPQGIHGFVLKPPTEEMIATSLDGLKAANNWEACERCKTRFQVFPGRRESDGALSTCGPCEFHWGKIFFQDLGQGIKGRGDRRYECCSEAVGVSAGCVKNEHHVYKVQNPARLATVLQYLETPANPELERRLGEKEVLRPVCMDAEMVFTVHGLELVRLTATSWPSGSELLDILVRPFGEILDMNTRYSGIFPEQLAEAKPWTESDPGNSTDLRVVSSPIEARDLLFRLLTPRTPIVGHGLENDFNAIRLVHPTVIDTAMLLPPKSGLPFRQSLKALMLNHLDRHIQLPVHLNSKKAESAEDGDSKVGHDSKEDANSAGDLVRYLIGKEWYKMRIEGWSWLNPPSNPSSKASPSPSTPSAALTGFEKHFVPPLPKLAAQTGQSMLSSAYLEARDPTVQAPIRDRRIGTGAPTLNGGPRGESNEERYNRERFERRRKDQAQKRKLEEEEREQEDSRGGAKRQRKVIAYDDLDGARDEDDEAE